MKVWSILFFVLLTVFLVGCGGSGGGGNDDNVGAFQGNFGGTWTSTNSWSGTSTIDVAPNGSFTGTFVNNTLSLDGTIQGQVVSDGSFEGTITIGGSDYNGDGEFTLSQDQTTMTGHMTYETTTFNFSFTRGPI